VNLAPLPSTYPETREALRTLACFVVAPARKAVDGRIGLRSTGEGFGTPPFGRAARRVVVHGAQLVVDEGGRPVERAAITTLSDAARVAGVELSADPGVGKDIPPFAPDDVLAVDTAASEALGQWYALVDMALVAVREQVVGRGRASDVNLWPEHFDLAFDWGPDDERRVNLGGSPGDASSAEPYLYVGPWERDVFRCDRYWNAPFGAAMPYAELRAASKPLDAAVEFLTAGIDRLGY
jgi:hypothetical protein